VVEEKPLPGSTTDAPSPEAWVADPAIDRRSTDGRRPDRPPIHLTVSRNEVPSVRSGAARPHRAEEDIALELQGVSCYYGSFRAVRDVDLRVAKREITALIGPSGCGKTTLLRTLNRMNDLIPSFRMDGRILFDGQDVFAARVDPVEVRRRVGMVFQKPNPFPKSIYDNVAFGPRINGYKGHMDELVEHSLRRAALWNEVKDKLKQSGLSLSGGQQQRLCIARAIATDPEVVLMDEPCSALDPRATLQIEELMNDLKNEVTIVIVTHNMQQAARASDTTVFLTMGDDRAGYVVETGVTNDIFTNPQNRLTEDYVSGRFG
jgi:phosphate transport system ATP-binding protein